MQASPKLCTVIEAWFNSWGQAVNYVSAAGRDWLLPFYDPFTKLLGMEAFHRSLIEQAAILPGYRVLEIGSGTGNLTILAKTMNPAAEFQGLDPDAKAVTRARRKAHRRRLQVQFDQGFSEDLPYPDAYFDRVLSAFMLHHVNPDAKSLTMREVFRVLKPGGSLHFADFGEGERPTGGFHGLIASKLHSRHGSSLHDIVLNLLRQAGFEETEEVAHRTNIMGRIVYYGALRPRPANAAA